MTELFIKICNMSLTASYVIIAVFLVRFFLKKFPKIFSYCLWAVVLFRLICPFSPESTWSLVRMDTEAISEGMGISGQQQLITGGSGPVDSVGILKEITAPAKPYESVNPEQIAVAVLTTIWLAGCMLLTGYGIVSYWRLKKQMQRLAAGDDCRKTMEYAGWKEVQILTDKAVDNPFVLGIIKPVIYMADGLAEAQRRYILAHEKAHIRRRDYLIKFGAYLVLCIYWMNPLVWLAFAGMNKDMEMSCDENVIRGLSSEDRKGYSKTLLEMAAGRKMFLSCPLAFGEGEVKGRIKNILNYKRPAFWVTIAGILAVAGIGIGLLVNPVKEPLKMLMDMAEETVTPAEWDTAVIATGLNGLRLDYEDQEKLIFHNYDGLFVYDRGRSEVIRSVNLADVEYENPQRDEYYYCAVSVSPDGEKVYFHTMNSEKIYVYSTADGKLMSMDYDTQTYLDFEKVDQSAVGTLAYVNSGDVVNSGIFYAEAGSNVYKPFITQGKSDLSGQQGDVSGIDVEESVTYTYTMEESDEGAEYLPSESITNTYYPIEIDGEYESMNAEVESEQKKKIAALEEAIAEHEAELEKIKHEAEVKKLEEAMVKEAEKAGKKK